MPAISIKNLCISNRHNNICHDINLEVLYGTCHAIIGADNEGKTSILHAVLGYNRCDSGTVTLLDEAVPSQCHKLHNRLGFVPDNLLFVNNLTGAQLLDMNMQLNRINESIDYAETLIDYFHVNPALCLNEMTEDMNKCFYIISSILCRPELLILDEPFNFLSTSSRDKLKAWLKTYVGNGNTVLITSDNYSDVSDICTSFSLMKEHTIMDKTFSSDELAPYKLISAKGINQKSIPDDTAILYQNQEICHLRFKGNVSRLKEILAELDCNDFTVKDITIDDITSGTYDWIGEDL
jgi:ABC-type multidrug transport system ATPase subunit